MPAAVLADGRTERVGALDEPVVERRNGRRRQPGAGLCEGLFGDMVHELGPVFMIGKEFVEFRPNALRMPLSMTATSAGNEMHRSLKFGGLLRGASANNDDVCHMMVSV
jgi:hypothetical protein